MIGFYFVWEDGCIWGPGVEAGLGLATGKGPIGNLGICRKDSWTGIGGVCFYAHVGWLIGVAASSHSR